MLLLDAPAPVTFDEIVEQTELYADRDESSRKSFERDKASLRSLGIEISTEIDEGDRGATRYRIDPEAYFLPDLDLTEGERLALQLGAGMVRLDAAWDDDAVLRLTDGLSTGLPAVVAELPSLDTLPTLHEGASTGAMARFRYADKRREVAVLGLFYREGNWYVAARESDTEKVFRVDRIDGNVTLGPPGAFAPRSDFDPATAMPNDPLLIGEGEEAVATVLVDATLAARIERLRGEDSVTTRHDDGSIEVALPVRNIDAFRSWLLGLRDHARVVGPPELVDDVVGWLLDMANGPS